MLSQAQSVDVQEPRRWKNICIFGGMGPRATVSFQKRIVDKCSWEFGCMQDGDYPFMVTISVGKDIVTEQGEVDPDRLLTWATRYLATLLEWEIHVIAIPCFNLHQYYELLSSVTTAPIVDLPRNIVERIHGLNVRRVLVLGSRGVSTLRRWRAFRELDGQVTLVFPPEDEQVRIDRMIVSVMNSPSIEDLRNEFLPYLRQSGQHYDAVLVACSELSVPLEGLTLPDNIIDAMAVLADVTLDLARK